MNAVSINLPLIYLSNSDLERTYILDAFPNDKLDLYVLEGESFVHKEIDVSFEKNVYYFPERVVLTYPYIHFFTPSKVWSYDIASGKFSDNVINYKNGLPSKGFTIKAMRDYFIFFDSYSTRTSILPNTTESIDLSTLFLTGEIKTNRFDNIVIENGKEYEFFDKQHLSSNSGIVSKKENEKRYKDFNGLLIEKIVDTFDLPGIEDSMSVFSHVTEMKK